MYTPWGILSSVGTPHGEHWDSVYSGKRSEEVSWFQREPVRSMELLSAGGAWPRSVLDVGAGDSLLGDRLLAAGVEDLTLLDLSATALERALDRLGHPAGVRTVVTDVTTWQPDRTWEAWHDRAVLHFLVDDADRANYAQVATRAVEPGGRAVIGVFAPDGPESCSGLPVRRQSATEIAALLGGGFRLEQVTDERHLTPWGAVQHFTWVMLRRIV